MRDIVLIPFTEAYTPGVISKRGLAHDFCLGGNKEGYI